LLPYCFLYRYIDFAFIVIKSHF